MVDSSFFSSRAIVAFVCVHTLPVLCREIDRTNIPITMRIDPFFSPSPFHVVSVRSSVCLLSLALRLQRNLNQRIYPMNKCGLWMMNTKANCRMKERRRRRLTKEMIRIGAEIRLTIFGLAVAGPLVRIIRRNNITLNF